MKNGFTLTELLATIAVLTIILVIAVPQIQKLIYNSRLKSFETTARIIARKAEDEAMDSKMLKENKSLACKDLVEMSDDYGLCTVKIEDNEAIVKLNGNTTGKFVGMTCKGTKRNMECEKNDGEIKPADNEEPEFYLMDLLNKKTTMNGCTGDGELIEVSHENGDVDYRYVGACPNNYVTFNNETWRIVGLLDTQKTLNGEKEKRIKLVRNASLGNYSWDSSESTINVGHGINQWGASLYKNGNEYEGADLMRELNTDYLNTELTENTTWYNGTNNKKDATFAINKVLKEDSQELIDEAVWYLGSASTLDIKSKRIYEIERGKVSTNQTTSANDTVKRTANWIGKVGLLYPSDYGYASSKCSDIYNMISYNNHDCHSNNWLATDYFYWLISPNSTRAFYSYWIYSGVYLNRGENSTAINVRPSLYLKENVLMSGKGTKDNPFTFSLK